MSCDIVDIEKTAENSQECIIYGAGVYGRKICELLTACGLKKKIAGFAVSEGQADGEKVLDLYVFSFEEAVKKYPEAVIFIAIKGAEELYRNIKQSRQGNVFLCRKQEIDQLYYRMFVRLWKQPIVYNKIFFMSNSGKGYMCNGKYITEELIRQRQNVDIVWAVKDIDCELPVQVRKVQVDTPEYFYEIATSKVWVDNCRKDIYIHKRADQYYIQTWHGSGPLKKVEKDVEDSLPLEYVQKAKHDGRMIDLFLSSTSANSVMYRDSFYSQGEIFECGSPRNDILIDSRKIEIEKIRNILGVENRENRLVLYAPTFRRTIEDSVKAYDLDADRIIKELEQRFGGSFLMVVRFHPDLSGNEQLRMLYSRCIQATDYEDTQELLAISDVLITDYSSIFWDFSLQKKPVFLYQNDEQAYLDDRGFYCPPSKWPYPRAYNQKELYEKIAEFEEETYQRKVDRFLRRWSSFDDGHASERAVERIMDVIRYPWNYGKEKQVVI